MRDDADRDLDGHEADDQRERDRERPDGRLGADAVVVAVLVLVRHARSLTAVERWRRVRRDPAGSRNKYEWDEELGGLALDRRLFTSMSYPADYGFVEGTLAEDGDPLDALVLVGEPTFPGCRIRVRAVGVFHMADEKGPDEKVLCVPLNDPSWSAIADIHDVPAQLRNEIEHFFQVYKDLEAKKTVDERLRQPLGRAGDHRRLARAALSGLACRSIARTRARRFSAREPAKPAAPSAIAPTNAIGSASTHAPSRLSIGAGRGCTVAGARGRSGRAPSASSRAARRSATGYHVVIRQ